jgi:hypothetical protein
MTHDAHGLAHRGAHDRFAEPARHAAHGSGRGRDVVGVEPDDAARQQQAPGRGVDEQGLAVPEMTRPVPGTQFVGDQAIRGIVIRNAQ